MKNKIKVFVLLLVCLVLVTTKDVRAEKTTLGDVSYMDILKDPDNVDLNIAYAQKQIKQGHLDKAQMALERVLLNAPDLHAVRMLYAIVLYRLDNRVEAKAAFNNLLSGGLSAEDKSIVEKYLADIEKKTQRTRYSVSVATGIQYDNNKNSATNGGRLLFLDRTIQTNLKKKSDYAKLLSITTEVRHDLGLQRAYEVYGRLTGFASDQSVREEFDLFYGRLDAGVTLPLEIGNIDVSLNLTNIHVGPASFLQSRGVRARWDIPINDSIFVPYLEQNSNLQLYRSHDDTSVATEQNGWKNETRIGTRINLASDKRLDVNISRMKTHASVDFRIFDRYAASAAYTQTFPKGLFATLRGSYNIDLYSAKDSFISQRTRHDKAYRFGVTFGAPLGGLMYGNKLPPEAQNIVITAGAQHVKNSSNIFNYVNSNITAKFMITKRINF